MVILQYVKGNLSFQHDTQIRKSQLEHKKEVCVLSMILLLIRLHMDLETQYFLFIFVSKIETNENLTGSHDILHLLGLNFTIRKKGWFEWNFIMADRRVSFGNF